MRWIRNIFLAVVVAIIIVDVLYEIAMDGRDLAELPMVLLVLGIFLIVTLWLLWALGLTRYGNAWVRQRSAVILSYVEQAVRLNLPLPQLLTAAQASEPRWIAGRIGALKDQLDKGGSITDALRKTVPGTSRRALALMGAAERVGRIGPELARLVRDEQDQQNRPFAERSFIRTYPVAMILVIVTILSLVMTFVMPKFQQIFRDFRVPLPPLTQAVVQLTTFEIDLTWLGLAIALTVAATVLIQIHRRTGWLGPERWLTSSRDLADICHVIGEEMKAGLPLNTAIRGAGELAVGGRMRRKLNAWAGGIEGGMSSKDAAISAGMPRLIAGLTVTADGFAFLSRYYAGKFSRVMILLRASAVPAIVFFFGILVAIVALTLFLPLVSLINSVSPAAGPYSSWL